MKKFRKNLDHTKENKTRLNNIMRREVNWIGHIIRINSLLHDVIDDGSGRNRKKKNIVL